MFAIKKNNKAIDIHTYVYTYPPAISDLEPQRLESCKPLSSVLNKFGHAS